LLLAWVEETKSVSFLNFHLFFILSTSRFNAAILFPQLAQFSQLGNA